MDSQNVETMLLQAFRDRFPALKTITHVDAAARSLLSSAARDAAVAHISERIDATAEKERWFDCQERVRRRFADLINAAPEEIAVTKNVSDGINAVANAIDWRAGDSVVICSAFEHPNNIYPWLHLARKDVTTVDVAIGPDGALPTQAIITALRPTTRAVAVATVSFSPGFRADLTTLGRACRERGILFLVDAAQSVGVLHTDVEHDMIDALAVSTQKGLTALYGLGFLYVRRYWAERLVPTYLARFGLDLGEAHEADYSAEAAERFAPAARRFEVGNPNFPGLVAAEVALSDILAVGTRVIEEHVLGLAGLLIEGIRDAGIPVVNANIVGRSHIVSVGGATGFDADSLHDWLRERRVHASVRRGTMRFSLHGYNDQSDIARIVSLCAEWRRAADAPPRVSR